MDKQSYFANDIFAKELQLIFEPCFYTVAEPALSAANSYYSFKLVDRALTCRHTQDGIKAFDNTCLHRCALIDPLGRGQRRFQCCYHGWQYDQNGNLCKAPSFDIEKIKLKKLRGVHLTNIKKLIFAHFKDGANLEAFSREVGSLIERLHLDLVAPPFHSEELHHNCNWKLLVENVLDREHLNYVHPASFALMDVSSDQPVEFDTGSYTLWSAVKPNSAKLMDMLKHFKGSAHHYLHGYVFPNLFLANTNNLVGFVNQLLPISASESLLRWELYELPALRELPDVVREQVRGQAIEFSRKVLNEDRPIVEMCQQGLEGSSFNPQVQEQEKQILAFHRIYKQAMDNTSFRGKDE